jgi:hypothetical protein
VVAVRGSQSLPDAAPHAGTGSKLESTAVAVRLTKVTSLRHGSQRLVRGARVG